jgi:chorismate mutase
MTSDEIAPADGQMPQAAPPSTDLPALRAEIDRIDDAMLNLLAARMSASAAMAAAKPGDGPPLRPARETQILKRLIAAAPDSVAPDVIIDLWRAMMGASARQQRAFDVIVAGAGDPLRLFDLARRHFGAGARITRADEPRAALNRVLEQATNVAVLPAPGPSGPGLWWPILSESRFHTIQIVAVLPHRRDAGAPEAVLAARGIPLEEVGAGADSTLCVCFDPHYRLARAFADANLAGKELARARTLTLAALDGFVPGDDPRLLAVAKAGLDGFRVVGSTAQV